MRACSTDMNDLTPHHPDLSYWDTAARLGVTHVPVACGTSNLGDDIQAAAACRWFNVSRFVERDAVETWPSGAVVPLVGWWNRGRGLLPPESVDFIVIGFHLQRERRPLLLSTPIRRRLREAVGKQGFPAGCRDLTTWKLLRDAAHFEKRAIAAAPGRSFGACGFAVHPGCVPFDYLSYYHINCRMLVKRAGLILTAHWPPERTPA
jgi:hypothetical protein